MKEKPQVDQIEAHWFLRAFVKSEGYCRNLRIASRVHHPQLGLMLDKTLLFVSAVFFLAGFVKGVIGLGLPTIAMGLLAIVMPPVEAAGLLILPSLLTNAWQMIAGPSLRPLVRRLWPTMLAVCLGTWAGLGLMTGVGARYGTALLGGALAIYALMGLFSVRFTLVRERERILGPATGVITGAITAATGVFVIPAVPYLQAIGLEREELVQALGLSFTVSTLALSVNLAAAGGFDVTMATPSLVALVLAGAGMWIGQIARLRLSARLFRPCFFIGLLLVGVHLVGRSLA
jgi:hypothetical protein